MRNRRHTLLWMKDLIDHMSRCHDQLQYAGDGQTQFFLAEAMLGDLVECQRLCEQLRTAPAGAKESAVHDLESCDGLISARTRRWNTRDRPWWRRTRRIRITCSVVDLQAIRCVRGSQGIVVDAT